MISPQKAVDRGTSVETHAALIGAGCSLPGAADIEQFWSLLAGERNVVTSRPHGRWSVERFLRPGNPEPGFTYTFAGGYIDNPFSFDPSPFGISPREAQQMDPQQRLLLEVTWRAFEDSSIAPSSLAGQNVGVYIGASTVDYQNGASHDPAVMGSHFMTGNSLSILSNRISYIFDLRGPSYTVDSACSSSLVALTEALRALRDGQIEMAIVGGVNLLLSPAPFIGFSQARMLSPTGLSRPFSQDADGYVRSEGAIVLVLRRLDDARARGERVRSVLLGSAVNSDGRTSGISLPSRDGQKTLIEGLYRDLKIDPEKLAFVEAHGTGTKVGDPIEAEAIGQSLGKHRVQPLPIGSVKSNIGHLEAVSGLAGLLKATLALEHRFLPRSLLCENLNESIDFAALNLSPTQQAVRLRDEGSLFAGVCNYGFGGTNAHVVMRSADPSENASATLPGNQENVRPRLLMVSAASRPALVERVHQLAEVLEAGAPITQIAGSLAHRSEIFAHRLAVPLEAPDLVSQLRSFSDDDNTLVSGLAPVSPRKTVFVYSGNGSQFEAMGRAAYRRNERFRHEIDEIDGYFQPLAGWSIAAALRDGIDATRLELTSVSQPLLFAIQSALTRVLAQFGVRPDGVLGHSVGEVAAAEASGALSRQEALSVIYLRSRHQEAVRGHGRMMVFAADERTIRTELAHSNIKGVEIAALNGPTSTTLSGKTQELEAFTAHCRRLRIAAVDIGVDYPFHSDALDSVEAILIHDLRDLAPQHGQIALYSTVTGKQLSGEALGASYWWENIRHPVLFEGAVSACLDDGMTCFIEIGPRAILTGTVKEIMRLRGVDGQAQGTLSNQDSELVDPIETVLADLVVTGAKVDLQAVFGSAPLKSYKLPVYPFQRQTYSLPETHEALLTFGRMVASEPRHPLLGARTSEGAPEWRNLIDPVLVPYLDDHRVNGAVVVPASGLIDMALSAGRELFDIKPIELETFDILKPLVLSPGEMREVSTRYAHQISGIEIWSRKRLGGDDEWILHAHGIVREARGSRLDVLSPPPVGTIHSSADEVYAEACRAGLEYGPYFQLVGETTSDWTICDAQLNPPKGGLGAYTDLHVINPISLDAAFHGLFIQRPQRDGEMKAHLPVRFRKFCVLKHGVTIRRAIAHITHETDRTKAIALSLLSETGELVASAEAAVFRAVYLSRASVDDRAFHETSLPVELSQANVASFCNMPSEVTDVGPVPQWLLVRAFAVSLTYTVLKRMIQNGAPADLATLVVTGHVADSAAPLLEGALNILSEFGAIERNGECVNLSETFSLPAPRAILATLMKRFPHSAFEIRLMAQAIDHFETALRTGRLLSATPSMMQRLADSSAIALTAIEALSQGLSSLPASDAGRPQVLVVAPFSRGLRRAVGEAARRGDIDLTFASPDKEALDILKEDLGHETPASFLIMNDQIESALRFDALVSLAVDALPEDHAAILRQSSQILRKGAPALIARPGADHALDLLCGLWRNWLSRHDGIVGGRIASNDELVAALVSSGFQTVAAKTLSDGRGSLIIGYAAGGPADTISASAIAVLGNTADSIEAFGIDQATSLASASQAPIWLAALDSAISPVILMPIPQAGRSGTEDLAVRIEAIKALLNALGDVNRSVKVFVITAGALSGEMPGCAQEAAIRGFVRVAINEYPAIDLRLIDIEAKEHSSLVADIVRRCGAEREWAINVNGAHVTRMRRGLEAARPLDGANRSHLQFAHAGRLDSFGWWQDTRRPPEANEVEIEVVAVGMNYRDVLVGLGILDDDLLSAGLTAASLGFECAGRVNRVGIDVTHLAPGDTVMGFGSGVFASHVTAPAWHFFKTPTGVTPEASATIPVAFATAWYGLVERGRLRAGETVLIHGAAGGVGLAAIQIAKHLGARVIGTASDPARRAIAAAAGADFLFDSRHERFADAIKREFDGVDLVLNSLAGSAMLSSFDLLKPFGRFIELGKRDYLENSQLGLRPFVRNISYAGVDLDELLAHDRPLIEDIMHKLAGLFGDGSLVALPYQVYEAQETAEAFRSMQASEHIGKILVRPAQMARRDIAAAEFKAIPGLYMVVGGTTGFGFETARWLARKGATGLLLVSRRGQVDESQTQTLEEIRSAGVQVMVRSLDVRDPVALRSCVENATSSYGPLRGVVHAAVQLDDGLIASLEPDRLRAVLATKVDGVINLDRATHDQPLDFFVAYSSATTVIGSPGQGAYVAANAFMEGWARQRRAAGKPALTIGWGAISDAGIIARDAQLGERLRRTTGVIGIRSGECLAHLGRLLSLGDGVDPVQFYTNISPGGAADKLSLLKSPTFADLGLVGNADHGETTVDLANLVAGKDKSEALALVTRLLKSEVAHILRMPESEVDVSRPLGDLGLDSLMGLELHLSIERLSGVQMPMIGASDRRLLDVAASILTHLDLAGEPSNDNAASATALALAEAHLSPDTRNTAVEQFKASMADASAEVPA